MADSVLAKMAVQISGNTAQFNKSMAEASKDLDKFGKEAKKASNESNNFGKSLTGLSGPLKLIAGLGIGAGLVSLGKTIFDLGVKQEQLNIAFSTFLGSADKARALISDLNEFAIVTPFTPDQVNNAAKALLAFGVAGDEIIPTLKQLGDVSAGTGKDLTEMAVIFGQIRSTGRLMGQDLLQLINAGFNPLQVISEKTGKSVAALKKEMEQGKISFEQVADAFKTATSEGGLFFNLMEKQSVSIGGLVSTIAGNIEEGFKNIFSQTQGPLKDFIDQLVRLSEAFREFTKGPDQKRQETFDKILKEQIDDFKNLVKIFDGDTEQALSVLEEQITRRKEIIKNLVFSLRDQIKDIPVGSTDPKDKALRDQEERLTNEFLAYDQLIPKIQDYIKSIKDVKPVAKQTAEALGLIAAVQAEIKRETDRQPGIFDEKELIKSNNRIKELNVELQRLKSLGESAGTPDLKTKSFADISTDLFAGLDEGLKARMPSIIANLKLIPATYTAVAEEVVSISGIISSGIADIANAFGEAIVGGEDFGKSFIKSLAKFAQQFGSLLIAIGIGEIALKSAPAPAKIAAGAALVALGAAASRLLSNPPSSRGGGSSGSSYNRNSTSAAFQDVSFSTSVSGTDLNIVLGNTANRDSFTKPQWR